MIFAKNLRSIFLKKKHVNWGSHITSSLILHNFYFFEEEILRIFFFLFLEEIFISLFDFIASSQGNLQGVTQPGKPVNVMKF